MRAFGIILVVLVMVLGVNGVFAKETKANTATKTAAVESKPAEKAVEQKAAATAESKPAEKAVEEKPVEEKPAADIVAVKVNGAVIMESAIQTEMEPQLKQLQAQLPPQMIEQFQSQLRQQVIDRLVVEKLLDEQLAAKGIKVTDADVEARINEMLAKQNPPLTMDDLKKLLESRGSSLDELKQRIHKGLGYEKLFDGVMAGKVNITEADAKKYYDENADEFKVEEQVKASHILIGLNSDDPNADPNKVKAEAKAKAEEVLKKVQAGGDFAKLAEEYSICPSKANGGDLGFFGKGKMVPEFENAAFSLKPGETSGVVETKFGYHIIKVIDHKDPNTISFDQAKAGITGNLEEEKKQGLATEYIEKLKTDAKIEYTQPVAAAGAEKEAEKPAEKAKADANSTAGEVKKETK